MERATVFGPLAPLTPPDSACSALLCGTPTRKRKSADGPRRAPRGGLALQKAALPAAGAATFWAEVLKMSPLLETSSAVQAALMCDEQLGPEEADGFKQREQLEQPQQPKQRMSPSAEVRGRDLVGFRRGAGRLVSTQSFVLGERFWDCAALRFGDLNELLRAAKGGATPKRPKKRRAA